MYDPEDRLAGGIESVDHRRRKRRFGITSVSVGLVALERRTRRQLPPLVEVAAEVKTAAKQTTGPVVLSNQRGLST